MKRIILGVIYLLALGNTVAQSINSTKTNSLDPTSVSLEERLVQLAWKNNASIKLATLQSEIAQAEVKVVGSEWSTLVGATGNLNEFNIKEFTGTQAEEQGNLFFPRYNVYVRLPLSLLVETPRKRKVALTKVRFEEEKVNLTKIQLRTEVLKLYSDYRKYEQIWIIRKQTLDDEESNFLLSTQNFKEGKNTLEEYIAVQRNRNEQRIQLAVAENDYIKSKLSLEELIGTKLEDVIK
jgi:outer membrane protein TolC